jgi:ribosome-associated protein
MPIRLDHFLKREGLTQTGGHAKQAIQGGEVMVNGLVETRRKRKLHAGDTVEFAGRSVVVTDADAPSSSVDRTH